MLPKIDPTTTASWQRLQRHFEEIKDVQMKTWFAQEPDRFERLAFPFRIFWWTFPSTGSPLRP